MCCMFVCDKYDNVVHLVEVNCQYKAGSKEMYDDKSFCCSLLTMTLYKRKIMPIFFQVQGQMALSGVHT